MKKLFIVRFDGKILGIFFKKEEAEEKAKDLLIKYITKCINGLGTEYGRGMRVYFEDYLKIEETEGEIEGDIE